MRRIALGAAAWLAATGCEAVTFAPGAADVAAAAAAGERLAQAGAGYPLAEYLVYQVADARALAPEDGCVDAIVAATPLERTRHAAYVAALEARPGDPAAARAAAGLPDHSFAIVVYAHGRQARDADFTQRFADVRLSVGGREVHPVAAEASEPVDATYPLAAADRRRPVATVTWRFDLAGLADDTTPLAWLSFTDACGRDLRIALPLAILR